MIAKVLWLRSASDPMSDAEIGQMTERGLHHLGWFLG
jgi:hypothetical protein